jgi:hypothetical protein
LNTPENTSGAVARAAVDVAGYQHRNRDWSEPVKEAIEEDDEQQQGAQDEKAGDRNAEIRDEVVLNAPQQRERIRERPDEQCEQYLQYPVAVQQAQ